MRLRPEPPRVTRLSRKVLAGSASPPASASAARCLCAPDPAWRRSGQELYSTDNRTTPDGLAGLPKDYSGVPKLGPPLPGDLGRPILNAQNAGQPVPTPGIATPAGPTGPARRNSAGRRSGSGTHRGCSPPPRRGPQQRATAATARRNRSRQPRRRRSRRRPRRRIASSPSSTRRPTSAPSRPIASPRPHRPTCFRPAR
jgi:type IV secretory pathway VirB10-like protein